MRVIARVMGAVLVALLIAACSSRGGGGGNTPTITIKDFGFGKTLTVSPGTTVLVRNEDNELHNVTSDAGDFKTRDLGEGDTDTFTAPSKPGSYPFHCTLHPFMRGTLVVKGSGG